MSKSEDQITVADQISAQIQTGNANNGREAPSTPQQQNTPFSFSGNQVSSDAMTPAYSLTPGSSAEKLRFIKPDHESLARLIKRYFYQITLGCGRGNCSNSACYSCPSSPKLDATAAAVLAARLARGSEHMLCPGVATDLPSHLQFSQVAAAVDAAVESDDLIPLIDQVKRVFGSLDSLSWSFIVEECPRRASDADSFLDWNGVRDSYTLLLAPEVGIVADELRDSILDMVTSSLRSCPPGIGLEALRAVFICLLHPHLLDHGQFKDIIKSLVTYLAGAPDNFKNAAVLWLQKMPRDLFREILVALQQFITIYVYENQCIDDHVANATRVLSLLNRANCISVSSDGNSELKVPFPDFYNDAVNELVDFQEDYTRWRDRARQCFSFCDHAFILEPAVKSKVLQMDSTSQMRTEILRGAIFRSLLLGAEHPYLVIKVRREMIVHDTLEQISALGADLKKPLKVVFQDEEGIDEGGVQKEFFQLIVREIFDPKYGMFVEDPDMRTVWFSPNSFNNNRRFFLIGVILGLAIYNSVILDVHFPMAAYKMLMDMPVGLLDMQDVSPQLSKGLQALLDFEGDVEDIFCRTFTVDFEQFGEVVSHDLKPGGSDIPVTNANREEYVSKYVNWVLYTSCKPAFDAFKEGFLSVCGGPALQLFRAEELELLVCGSRDLDFSALEDAALAEDGYDRGHEVIQNLWSVVHEMTPVQKKKFLFFCTGSDRAPIKGLGSMTFVVSRNGPDSDRLPTAHTCFNHLLLPEYSSREKLKSRLLTAINNAEGFGLM